VETQVRTPQDVFMQPQRLIVPLFQRPYVWNQEEQWEPLWNDVLRLANRIIEKPGVKCAPHFLGAVVLQQQPGPTGLMQQRMIIDGQQRLTTLQLLLDALHAELLHAGQVPPALRIEQLVANLAPFRSRPEDRFKVWPTNRDRPAFNAVMSLEPPIDYAKAGHQGERMVAAHRFFAEQARAWLGQDQEAVGDRAAAIETVVRELLQLVVIDLGQDENAQAIFETLNARGTPLTAADLIKNFVFQKLLESDAPVEEAYETHWKEFETAFWETEIQTGRLRQVRSSVFLNHWLIARMGREVVAREVFARFKSFAEFDAGVPMKALLGQIHEAAQTYRSFVVASEAHSGAMDHLALFGYRTGALESEVVKPLILWLLDPSDPVIPTEQVRTALAAVESWMVRRMLVRGTTKGYNNFVADLIQHLRGSERALAGTVTAAFLASQTSDSRYWPGDEEVRSELREQQVYRRLQRGRLRMLLEAIEDHKRGWVGGQDSLGSERVARGKYAIEHVMPRRWQTHWPLGDQAETTRELLMHTIGNLTLLTGRLNSRASNGPWLGEKGKREALQAHDVLFLNRELVRGNPEPWTEQAIRARTEAMITDMLGIWPVPPGHRIGFGTGKVRPLPSLEILDLINADVLSPGTILTPRNSKFADRRATVLGNGQLDLEGKVFATPSGAAVALTGKPTNGWWFFLVDVAAKRSLRDVLRAYVEKLSVDVEQDDDDEDDE
jgi:hypothetical protein